MKDIFSSFGIEISDKQLSQFENYFNLLIEYNNKFNITAITEKKEVYEKHFIDSILVANRFIKEGESIKMLDVGSGGGFPAIPIKIMYPNINLTLLEATGKKCEFLKAVIDNLDLNDVTVVNDRAELFVKKDGVRENFSICTARAVARLNTLCEYCMPFVKLGGYFVSYKGDAEQEIKEAENAINILGGKIEEVYGYNLLDAKRTLIKIRKVKETPKKYPRGNGKERKNPL